MLPGLIRTQCAPASSALIASVWLKWMSAITGIGDSATIVRSAATSCSRGTATRTMSAPASATRRIWSIVACRLAVSVFVIVCTATGAPPPMGTPPTWICRAEAMRPSVFAASRAPTLHDVPASQDVYATARGRLRARVARPARRERAPHGATSSFFATDRRPSPACAIVDIGCGALGLRALEPRPRHHGRRPRPAPGLPRAVRAGRRHRAACPSPTASSTSRTRRA